jgi:hypothetical protein
MTDTAPANPQGKGVVSLLQDWQQFQPEVAASLNARKLLAEYFSSLLVLSAKISFKPIKGRNYYLYYRKSQWLLSMIEPQRWDEQKRGLFFGSCQLQIDMTWTIDVIEDLEKYSELQEALEAFQQQLAAHLNNDQPLADTLPFYVESLPFYARLCATGLAKSLSLSFDSMGILEKPARRWLQKANYNQTFTIAP